MTMTVTAAFMGSALTGAISGGRSDRGSTRITMNHEPSVPIVVQHTRLDSRECTLALLSTVAYSSD
jgi:hypothetical protein